MLNQTPPDDSRFYVQPFVPSIIQQFSEEIGPTGFVGPTKRELFAAMAMMGLLANSTLRVSFEHLAKNAVNAADALIAKLEGEIKDA